MGLAANPYSRNLAQFSGALSAAEVDALVDNRDVEVIQTTSPVLLDTAELLDERLFPKRPDLLLRVHSFSGEKCDLAFLDRMPQVRRFAADCLMDATGVEHVASLPRLLDLTIGIYSLQDFGFLSDVASDLEGLSLEATKSKKPSLEPLARFRHLKRLHLEGQQKDPEVIAGLTQLEEVTLRSITASDLEFLRPLERLWSVDIKLGGTTNLAALAGKECIKYLELWQVRGLADLQVVSTLTGLQSLFLQSLPQVKALPDLTPLRKLRRLHLETMKGLNDVRGVAAAPALEEFFHLDAKGMTPEDYREVLKLKTLRRLCVGTGSASKNEAIEKMAAAAGVATDRASLFELV